MKSLLFYLLLLVCLMNLESQNEGYQCCRIVFGVFRNPIPVRPVSTVNEAEEVRLAFRSFGNPSFRASASPLPNLRCLGG
jgi:hypothetical protein